MCGLLAIPWTHSCNVAPIKNKPSAACPSNPTSWKTTILWGKVPSDHTVAYFPNNFKITSDYIVNKIRNTALVRHQHIMREQKLFSGHRWFLDAFELRACEWPPGVPSATPNAIVFLLPAWPICVGSSQCGYRSALLLLLINILFQAEALTTCLLEPSSTPSRNRQIGEFPQSTI